VTDTLALYSLVLVYSAMAVYALAFVVFALDLGRRASAVTPANADLVAAASGVKSRAGGGTATAVLERPVASITEDPGAKTPRSRFARIALALTILAWLLHVAGDVLRGIAANRVPWANMFEFTLTATAIIVGIFLAVQLWQRLEFLGVFIIGFALAALGVATVNFYVAVVPLPSALQSVWLVVHVFVAATATGFLAVGGALSITQLLQARRASLGRGAAFLTRLPDAERLEALAYRVIVVGFVFWTFTLIAGAIWAERAWGRYWGWDTKEVWTFIIWTLFAGYIHARATRGWRGSRSAWLAIIGFTAIVFNFTIVNLFFKGLHAYSGL
jgi:cytochrome c-type biogenesis protein CcsB